ncbi:PQQ-binding-like beta-propeller repeat protein, partial [bacterium]|nr:PQQ-binding-like beta-propeller repeat protein [bacterium]
MRLTKTPFSLCLAACFLSQAIPAWAAVKIMNYKDFSSKYGTAQVLDLALDSLGGPWCAVLDKATLNTGAGDIQDRGALLNYRSVGGGSWATVSLGKQDSPRLVSRAVAAGPGVTVWSAVGRTIRKVTQFEQYKYNLDEFDFSSTQGTVTVIPEDGSKTYDTTTSGLDFGACNDIAVDAAGNVWLACSGGIFLLDGSTRLGAALAGSGLSPWKQAVRVGDGYTSCIALDRSGGAYFGTRSSGVLKYDGQKWSQAAAPGAPVTAITVGPQGRLWFATAPVAGVMGIHQLENGALKSQNFTVGGADRWNEVSSMAFDNQGKLWVGTLGGGVKVYNGTAWTGYGTADGLASDVVNAVLVESADRVWFGTDEGVSLLLFTNSPDPARAADAHILKSAQLTDSAGVFFVGRLNGKFIAGMGPGFNNEVKWSFNTGGTILSSPAADRNGVLYFGSGDKKIYALYPNGQLKWSYETGGAVVSSPAVDVDGSVYVGSKDGYLYALTRSGA